MKDVAGAAIGAGASLAGNLFGMIGQKKRMKDQANIGYQVSEAQANNAHKRQMQTMGLMYHMNSPEQMKQRLKDAGMNPALMNGGSGAGGQAQASSAPQGSTNVQAFDPANAMSAGGAMGAQAAGVMLALKHAKKVDAEVKNINADTALKGGQTTQTGAQTELINAQTVSEGLKQEAQSLNNQYQTVENEIQGLTKGASIQGAWQGLRKLTNEAALMFEKEKEAATNNKTLQQQNELNISESQTRIQKLATDIIATQAGTDLTRKTIEKAVAEISDIYRQQGFEAEKIDNNRDLIIEMKRHNMSTESIQEVQNVLRTGEIGVDLFKSLIPWASAKAPAQAVKGFGK